MRTNLDFAPLYRSSVGFDRMFGLLENASRVQSVDDWPAYDIVKLADDEYQIAMALAGFTDDELVLTYEPNLLVVEGRKADEGKRDYLHRGIDDRAFKCRFELADHVQINGANLINGVLTIDLKQELPEARKPRRIEIGASPDAWSNPTRIDDDRQAA